MDCSNNIDKINPQAPSHLYNVCLQIYSNSEHFPLFEVEQSSDRFVEEEQPETEDNSISESELLKLMHSGMNPNVIDQYLIYKSEKNINGQTTESFEVYITEKRYKK